MSHDAQLLGAFERHDADAIRATIAAGASAVAPLNGKSPIVALTEMYTRSARFAACLRVLLDTGASFDDPLLGALLLDEEDQLRAVLAAAPSERDHRFGLECPSTSLHGATPLHVCAEYNSVHCARVLLDAGHPVDAPARTDANGFGGQTPLFHTVNSNRKFCRPMLELLVSAGASVEVRLKGLVWAQGFDWETTIVDVTPLSYAQCGLYFQFHRREEDVYANVAYLFQRRFGVALPIHNVPNRYLQDPRVFPPRM